MKHASVIAALTCLILAVAGAATAATIQWLSVDYSFQADWSETFIVYGLETSATWRNEGSYSSASQNDVPFMANIAGPSSRFNVSTSMNRSGDFLSFINAASADPWDAPFTPYPNDPDTEMITNAMVSSTSTVCWKFRPLHTQLIVDLEAEQFYNYSPDEQSFTIALKDLAGTSTLLDLRVLRDGISPTHYKFAADPSHEYELTVSAWAWAWDAKDVYQSFDAAIISVPEASTGVLIGFSLFGGLAVARAFRHLRR